MAKLVFQEVEVVNMDSTAFIPAPKIEQQVLELEEEYAGPTAEDIEAENKKRIEVAEEEAGKIIVDANQEADRIVKEAEKGSFDYIKGATEKTKILNDKVKVDIEKYKLEREDALNKKIEEQKEKFKKEYEEVKENARQKGYKEGYESGRREVERLTERLHTIIEGTIDRRDSIIEDAEIQVIRIVLLIARKVVKAISEEQKGVIIENIKSALQKIKGKTQIIIRVNTEDLELTTEHKDALMQKFEELQHVTILEDTRVDKGGCIIETDFGSVDARIATQLQEIEEKIRELANLSYFEGTRTIKGKKKIKTEKEEIKEIEQELESENTIDTEIIEEKETEEAIV